jgi:tryptophan-rich sensory protein
VGAFYHIGFARFRLKSPLLGYLNTTLYFASIVASAARAARIDRRLLAPYATLIPWLLLATILSLYQLNDEDPLFEGSSR